MAETGYAELHSLSNFSFLRGASSPEELVLAADSLGYQALALTDECSVAGVVKAWQAIKKHQLSLTLIIGAEFQFEGHLVVILAKNRKGYAQTCQLITVARRRSKKGSYKIISSDFDGMSDCICLWKPNLRQEDTVRQESLAYWKSRFSNRLWLLVENLLTPGSSILQTELIAWAQKNTCPVVAAGNVHMHCSQRKPLQDVLTAIRHNDTLENVVAELFPNAENHLRSISRIKDIYPEFCLQASLQIAESCQFDLGELSYQYPEEWLPEGKTPASYLAQLTWDGAKARYPEGISEKVSETIKKELSVIAELSFEPYFLTIYDIVRFARSQGILCQGRGSAANSVVCFCLSITEVNPEEVSLLFERFISTARREPPDIDVDFEHERREEVIQYIYQTYGRERAALAATVICYRRKSALRDVAKALAVVPAQLDQVIASYGWRYHSRDWLDEVLQPVNGVSTRTMVLLKHLVQQILGFPRHLSQHVGGFVITSDPVTHMVPVENAAMADRTIIQWDKEDLQAVGMMKIDVLALGMLTAIRKSLALIRSYQGLNVRIQDISRSDSQVFDMICRADTVGVFQIESRAQMNMLPRLKPVQFYDLVVQIAIVRPGPIHGDMVHPYLKRRQGLEKVEFPNDVLIPILERTYGVPIFQEQIIQLAMIAGGFSAGEADQLRRSMASWKRSGHISELREKLTLKMRNNGYPEDYISRINRQIEGFGEYGFPESHAASFALLAYISAWLKCHYPAAFCCALLNSQPMGFYTGYQLVQDAKRHGVTVLPVCINQSTADHQLQGDICDPSIRLGFRQVRGLSVQDIKRIIENRPEAGFQSVDDLSAVNGLSRQGLDALASAGALSAITRSDRYQTRWQTAALNRELPLLDTGYNSPPLQVRSPDALETYQEDQYSLGLTLGEHPVAILRRKGLLPDTVKSDSLLAMQHKSNIRLCGMVTNRQRPKTKTGVTFVTLEDETGSANLIVWEQVARRFLKTLTTSKILIVQGVLELDDSRKVAHVIVQTMMSADQNFVLNTVKSRDYR